MVYQIYQASFIDVGLTMFFVGDAAGRLAGHATSRVKDFADTDRYPHPSNLHLIIRKFAMNLKIPFHTPEEYFLGDPPAKYIIGAFNPLEFIPTSPSSTVAVAIPPSSSPDIIL